MTLLANYNKLKTMGNWVEFLVTYDETEADIIKDILEAEGIEVVKNSLKVRPYPVGIGRMGEVRLLVRQESLEDAEEILKIMQEGSEKGIE